MNAQTFLEHTLLAMEAVMPRKLKVKLKPPLTGVRVLVPLRAGRLACNPAVVLFRDYNGSIDLHSVNVPMPGFVHTIKADTLDRDTYEAIVEAVMAAIENKRDASELDSVEQFFPYTGGRFL